MMPNVNSAEEMVDLMAAGRAYEANIPAVSYTHLDVYKRQSMFREN